MDKPAWLVLQNGITLKGIAIGDGTPKSGELVFNTAHVGYQETLSDPSYADQILIFTSPHIGNIGCNASDQESKRIWAAGVVLREKPSSSFYWRAEETFEQFLIKNQLPGIAEIDTRYLTRLLVQEGNQTGFITTDSALIPKPNETYLLPRVSTKEIYPLQPHGKLHIVVYDFGVKQNILRALQYHSAKITVVPHDTSLETLTSLKPDGIVLSNGPGDPRDFISTIALVKKIIKQSYPILGICLGHQLLGLALGAEIKKLKFGHHGINHPIQELSTKKVLISSQNHNFAIAEENLPSSMHITFRSLFDNSIQGFQHSAMPIFGIQCHPEGCPGPRELEMIFTTFLEASHQHRKIQHAQTA